MDLGGEQGAAAVEIESDEFGEHQPDLVVVLHPAVQRLKHIRRAHDQLHQRHIGDALLQVPEVAAPGHQGLRACAEEVLGGLFRLAGPHRLHQHLPPGDLRREDLLGNDLALCLLGDDKTDTISHRDPLLLPRV